MKISFVVVLLLTTVAYASDFFTFYPQTDIESTTLSDLRISELTKLNSFRLAYGVSPDLRTTPLQYPNLCPFISGNCCNFGQNLYKSVAYPFIKYYNETATQKWQDEKSNYNYTSGTAIDPSKMIGHFTAQIWKKVTSVGFGFCTTTQDYVYSPTVTLTLAVLYVVANYYLAPNMQGQYTQNVFPPL